tara:strand:+ start:481 stop:681 length:201 start_codon:yes stop_codon:yes gene_type:complete
MPRNYSDYNEDISSTKDISSNQPKTTDVNILLNRVRLDKKKAFKKNILVSLLVVSLVCAISIFLII